MNASLAPSPRAEGSDDLRFVLILGLLTALGPLSIDLYLPSLPRIAASLGAADAAVQLTLSAFFAGLCLGQLVYGPLTDRYGRKPPLYWGLGLYIVASLVCAAAPRVEVLIAGRFLQAMGGAAGQVVTRAAVRDRYVGAAAARLLSRLTLVMGLAPILAPMLGAQLLRVASWRALFVALSLAGVACLALMVRHLPETATRRTERLSPRGVLAGLGEVLGDRGFRSAALAGAFAQAGMFAYIAGSPFVLMGHYHLTPGRYGQVFGMNAAGLIAGAQVNHRLLAGRGPQTLLGRASAVIALDGALLMGLGLWGHAPLGAVLAALFVFVASLGFVGSNATALAMESQGARAGLASAALGATSFLLAAASSGAVSALNDTTLRPLGAVMCACGVGSAAAAQASRRLRRA